MTCVTIMCDLVCASVQADEEVLLTLLITDTRHSGRLTKISNWKGYLVEHERWLFHIVASYSDLFHVSTYLQEISGAVVASAISLMSPLSLPCSWGLHSALSLPSSNLRDSGCTRTRNS